jgi:hypothetical protein
MTRLSFRGNLLPLGAVVIFDTTGNFDDPARDE